MFNFDFNMFDISTLYNFKVFFLNTFPHYGILFLLLFVIIIIICSHQRSQKPNRQVSKILKRISSRTETYCVFRQRRHVFSSEAILL